MEPKIKDYNKMFSFAKGSCIYESLKMYIIVIIMSSGNLRPVENLSPYFRHKDAEEACEKLALDNKGNKYSFVEVDPKINNICQVQNVYWRPAEY